MVGVPCYGIRLPGDSGDIGRNLYVLDGASLTISTGASGAGKFRAEASAPTVRLAIRLSIWSASTESLRSFRRLLTKVPV